MLHFLANIIDLHTGIGRAEEHRLLAEQKARELVEEEASFAASAGTVELRDAYEDAAGAEEGGAVEAKKEEAGEVLYPLLVGVLGKTTTTTMMMMGRGIET